MPRLRDSTVTESTNPIKSMNTDHTHDNLCSLQFLGLIWKSQKSKFHSEYEFLHSQKVNYTNYGQLKSLP
jgi:hypothetical protein